MWKSFKALGAASTQGHVDGQASLDAGELQFPESSSCVTKTKSGKPAPARKKNKELLQKHGFDVLGQSFGIPSRADFEKEALMNTPPKQTAHRRSFSASPSDQDFEVYLDEDLSPRAKLKPVHHKKANTPSSSEKRIRHKPGQTVMCPENIQLPMASTKQGHRQRSRAMSQSTTSSSAKESRKQMVMYKSDDDEDTDSEITQSSTSFYLPQPPPPPNIPRQNHMAYYPTHPTMAAYMPVVYPMAGNGYHITQNPVAAPFPGFYYAQPLPQYSQAAGSNEYPQGFVMNQVGPLPVPSHLLQPQLGSMASCIPPMANITAGLVPPPPPPPPPPIAKAGVTSHGDTQAEVDNGKAVSAGGDEPARDSNSNSGHQQDGPLLGRDPRQSTELESKMLVNNSEKQQEESTAVQDGEEPSGFPYKHVCAGCGKTRSNGYHMTHRLKKGETAEPDYCRRCVAAAAFTDSEAPSMDGLVSSVLGEEANPFGEYDSSPRDPGNAFGSIPATPTDAASSSHDAYPYIVNDSWGYEQSHFEKMAEELAEEDLMRAGKRSGLFDSSRDSSTASSNPFFGNLTPSLISIESCPSDEERTDGNDHYEMAAGGVSDGEEEDTATGKKSPKQLGKHIWDTSIGSWHTDDFIEFSSSEDHVRKTAKYSKYADNRHNNVKTTGYRMPDARNMYNHYDMESTLSSHSSDFQPPADGSSLLAHTGHSMDDIPFSDTRAPVADSAALVAFCDPDLATSHQRRIRFHAILPCL
ncbi:uncharacterized protein PG986_007192 [Apiospora aurea]|uniref:Uncharacterized protein n=1 Tax=Apiospora aurea TaxID=335848 RepID=A0ABR1QC56_9PEZI